MRVEIIQRAIALVFFASLFVLFTLVGLFRRSDFLIPLGVVALIGIAMLFRARPDQSWTMLFVIVALPVFWLLILAWGAIFFVGLRQLQNHDWVLHTLRIAPWLYVVIASLCIWRLPKARLFALIHSVVNLYFVLGFTFISGMAVTGIWL